MDKKQPEAQERKFWKRLCALNRFSFFYMGGGVARASDKSGNWIEVHSAQEIVDDAECEVSALTARITALESQLAQRFDAADMATVAAQGFRDGVAAPQPAVAAGWQSIETAPKDGSYLLLWEQYSDAPFVGYWSGGSWSVSHEHVDAEGGWDGANVVDALSMPITHWIPLPAAPGPADGESK